MVNHKVPFPFTDPEKEAVTSCSSIPTHNTTEESHTSKGFRLLPPQGSTIVRISNNASQVFAEENLVRGYAATTKATSQQTDTKKLATSRLDTKLEGVSVVTIKGLISLTTRAAGSIFFREDHLL